MKTRFSKLFVVAALVACFASSGFAQSDTTTARTDFQNLIYTNTPTITPGTSLTNDFSASVAFFSGNIGAATNELIGSTNIIRPNDSQGTYLLASSIGQPVGLYTVPFNLYVQGAGTNSTVPLPELWYQLEQTVTLQPTPGRYYKFSQWSDGDTSNPRTVVAGATNGYTAVFTVTNGVTLFTTNIAGTDYVTELGKPLVFLNGQFYPHDVVVTTNGTQFSVTIVPTYTNGITRFTLDGSDPAAGTLYTGATNVTAPFRIRTKGFTSVNTNPRESDAVVSLQKSTPGGGSVAALPQTDFFDGGSSTVLTATPDAGWTFLNWTGDSSSTNPVILLTNDQPRAVTAIFGTSLTLQANGSGTISNLPAQSLYAYGATVRLAAIPAPGNSFSSWGDAVSGSVSPVDFTVTNANPGVQANFANLSGGNQSLAVVSFSAAGFPGGEVLRNPAANVFTNGATVTLIASNYPGQSFVGWSGDASGTSTNLTVTMTNSKVIFAEFAVTQARFQLAAANYSVNQADGNVVVTVQNIGVLSNTVTLSTSDDTATGGNGVTTGDYGTVTTNLYFASGPSNRTVSIPIRNQFLIAPSRSFQVSLGGAPLESVSNATVTINYSGLLATNGSQLLQAYPTPAVTTFSGSLQLSNSPVESAGQWRFRWEDYWHVENYVATNLEAGSYDIEFRVVPGFVPRPIYGAQNVTNGGLTIGIAEYLPSSPADGFGALKINIGSPAGARWRIRGEAAWRTTGDVATNLPVGFHVVEFATEQGWKSPDLYQATVNVGTNVPLTFNYTSVSLPPNALLPVPLTNFNQINVGSTTLPRLPFVFNGQLKSPRLGWASGVAVLSNVVLTASHVVFDYDTLSYVGPLYWFPQRQIGENDPHPKTVRGWIKMSGYAEQRWADKTNAPPVPAGQSSDATYNRDVATLYFTGTALRGGFGGFLSSDATPNEWLTGTNSKILVGYAVDGSAIGYTNAVPGMMHTTTPTNLGLSHLSSRLYTTPSIIGLPGNSGGSLHVMAGNGLYYPAGIYVGVKNDSSLSVFRAIDSEVVTNIWLASATGNLGNDNNAGGPIIPGTSVTPQNPAYLSVTFSPAAAVQAGAGWRLLGKTYPYQTNPGYVEVVSTNIATVDCKPLPGWRNPAVTNISVVVAQSTTTNLTYVVDPPQMSFNPNTGIGITGTTNTKYRIEYTTNLVSGAWQTLQTNIINNGGFNPLLPWPPTNGLPAAFYRAVWLP